MTWSVFGTLAHAAPETRAGLCRALFRLIEIPASNITRAGLWLWRRIPHPDTLIRGGPEIDFGIQTDEVVLLGEAKWLSDVGGGQGKNRDKDQLTLRREFVQKYGRVLYPGTGRFVVLSVSAVGNMQPSTDDDLGFATLHCRDTTWGRLCDLTAHPLSGELQQYRAWKERNSRAG